jgi:hypothetical protein
LFIFLGRRGKLITTRLKNCKKLRRRFDREFNKEDCIYASSWPEREQTFLQQVRDAAELLDLISAHLESVARYG